MENEEGYVLIDNNEPLYPELPSSCTIYVSNVSNKANEKSLREFFGICGQIKSITLEPHGENQNAMIVFENDEAAKTAIFLNDTFMFDGTINVIPYAEHIGNSPKTEKLNQENNNSKPSEPQTTSFWVNSLASAYMFGNNAWKKVLEFDEKHKITATINEKANQLDQSLKISERSKIAAQKFGEIAENVDKKINFKENTQKISTKTNETLVNLRERNEKTQTFFNKLDEVGKKIGNSWEDAMNRAQEKIDIVKSEIKRREEEEKKGSVEVIQLDTLTEETIIVNPNSTQENSDVPKEEQPLIQNQENNTNTNTNTNQN